LASWPSDPITSTPAATSSSRAAWTSSTSNSGTGPLACRPKNSKYGWPGAITWTWSPSEVENSTVAGSSKFTRRPSTSRRKPTIAS